MNSWIRKMYRRTTRRTPSFFARRFRVMRDVALGMWRSIDASNKDNRNKVRAINRAISRHASAVSLHAKSTRVAIRHIRNTLIPRKIRSSENRMRAWVAGRLLRAVSPLALGIARLRRDLNDRIADVRRDQRQDHTWTIIQLGLLDKLLDGLTRNLRHVLGGPLRLANWLVAAMIGALWRYILSHELAIGRWIRDRAIAASLAGVGRLERVIARLL